MKLPEPLEKLHEMKRAKAIGLLATFALNMAVLLVAINIDPDLGYYLMMVGFVAITFIVPYLFGWRDSKMLLVAGVGMLLLVGAINGPLVVHSAYTTEQGEPVTSSTHVTWFTKTYTDLENETYETTAAWFRLSGGNVSIYKGESGMVYRFNVTLRSNATFDAPPIIQLGYAKGIWGIGEDSPQMTESDPTDLTYDDGKDFHYDMTIEDAGIYSHWFAIVFDSGNDINSVNTTVGLGPLVGSELDNWSMYIPIGALSMFCNIGLLFLIIVLLYWWLNVAREKRRTWDKALRQKEDEAVAETPEARDDALEEKKPFTCDQCGAGVGVDDNFCPKCGERFDGEIDVPEKPKEGTEKEKTE